MILVFVEHQDGRVERESLGPLAFARRLARELGTPLHAVMIGAGSDDVVSTLREFGVAEAHVADDGRLVAYAPAAWAASIAGLVRTTAPALLIAGGGDRATEVAAHVAARLELPMAANCVDVLSGHPTRVIRQRWGGSLLEEAALQSASAVITVASQAVAGPDATEPVGSIQPIQPPDVVIRPFAPALADGDFRARVVGTIEPERAGRALADARVVVGGGRGVGSSEAFASLDELARLLDGSVGVSRAVTSAGWRPHAQQVGQTGARIAPQLYIACGISGAIQHIVGCRAAKRILAINSDPDAPIMTRANYAVIGDLHTIVPALVAELRRRSTG